MILPDPADDSTPPPIDAESRTCNICGESRPVATEFYLYTNGRPMRRCKACHRVRAAEGRKPTREAAKVATAERRRVRRLEPPPPTKFCRGCERDLPIEAYRAPDGRRRYSRCYACIMAQNARFREEHGQDISRRNSERNKARRKVDPAFRARERTYQDRYKARHPECYVRIKVRRREAYRFDLGFRIKVLGQVAAYRARNPQKVKQTGRKHYAGHKENYFAHNHNRRARKRGNGGRHTAAEWADLKAKYGHKCLRCGRKEPWVKLTRDHIIPIARGGGNSIDEIQPLCLRCNLRKGLRTIDYRPKVAAPPPGMLGFMA